MIARALVLALVLAWAPARADDAADQAAFVAASQRLGDGDARGARAAFEALAAAAPDGRWADDALAEAAALAEADGDLAGARGLWGRIVRDHGDGRLARRAQARLDALAAAGGVDGRFDAVAAAHDRLVRAAAAAEDPHAALVELAALLDGHADYPAWFTAALWLGEAWARIGERGQAAAWIDRAIASAPGPRERFRGQLARAELDADRGDLAAARARLRALVPPDDVAASARAELLAELDRRASRQGWRRVAWGTLALLLAAALVTLRRQHRGWRAAGAALWPPPLEVAYLVPVAVGVALVAHSGNPLAATAVERILLGAVGLAWIAGAVARGPLRLGARLGFVAAVALAVVAVAYLSVVDDQLLDLLLETWRAGHDMR